MNDSLSSIGMAVRDRRVSAVELARRALESVRSDEPRLKAYLQVFDDEAIRQAQAVDERIACGEGDSLPLAGVPVAIKDNICLSWGRTTCASRMLEQYESPFTATAAQKLIDAGAIIVGKTNLDEFAMGSSTENSAFGPSRNPWDPSRVPGGSSGGSAATVAARGVPLALGSDTGGSIRQPAGLCGIVGIKPTYGRISRYGLVAFASSLDQIGTLTATVEDAALALEVICGPDPLDSTSANHTVERFSHDLDRPVTGLVIGVPRQASNTANHPGVARAFEEAVKTYQKLGARIVEIDLPMTDYGIAAYYIVAPAEASSNLARFDGIRYGHRARIGAGEGLLELYNRSRAEGFCPEVKRRIMLGTHVLSSGYYDAYYNTALKVRRKIKADYDAAFIAEGCHAILMPAAPGPAFRIGEKVDDPLAMYLEDLYTVGVNLAGLPGITVPGGFAQIDGTRLPVGMQLVGPAWSEGQLLRIARMFEHECPHGAERPKPAAV
ncbi:MAG: Asp-tRNA(Asn)/Glu-tRNA(Gln) amidotransferase subunit GatA [Phycisphaerales bacterium]|nr:Asp-tRNA(Asn)/Glu-tRNA(Gln) amidotransferase subunit GatA [Phycisphaerales bacterium]